MFMLSHRFCFDLLFSEVCKENAIPLCTPNCDKKDTTTEMQFYFIWGLKGYLVPFNYPVRHHVCDKHTISFELCPRQMTIK